MKKTIVLGILVVSLSVNFYMFGKWLFWDLWYVPTEEEQIFLNQMAQLTVESEDYQHIAKYSDVIALAPSINKSMGGHFPFNMQIEVKTTKKTFTFTCEDATCSKMSIGGEYLTTYTDEDLLLPFKISN
ncbi:hypothetical protein MHB44_21970 [Lysinibacillus sp. FSL H8-0500]|uniref:hypothetical protein n=1 Tax=Lysinibacillus sp. FSL H8-0500 TaxID=2921393 RepID=UPI003100F26E